MFFKFEFNKITMAIAEGTLTDQYGNIEVIPCWKWLLKDNNYTDIYGDNPMKRHSTKYS